MLSIKSATSGALGSCATAISQRSRVGPPAPGACCFCGTMPVPRRSHGKREMRSIIRIYGRMTMASWVGTARKSRSLKELDVGDLYDQLESMGAYIKELTSGFGKKASRQYGRARDVVTDTAHDAEATMKDNLAASLILAVGLGMLIGYM